MHNHPNDTGASHEDLKSAFDAGAKLLIVITRDGREQVFIRGRDRMVEVRDGKTSYEIGPGTLDETLWLQAQSQAQARKYLDDPPEYVFLQDDPSQLESDIHVPEGMTREQAVELFKHFYGEEVSPEGYQVLLSVWEDGWTEDSGTWPEKAVLAELMKSGGVIEQAVQNWNHPASGMSDDEFAALLIAHLRQEGHYRRKYSPYLADQWENFGDFVKNLLSTKSSVGPANLRIPVAEQILGTVTDDPYIPMPPTFPTGSIAFDDGHKLDQLVGDQWRLYDSNTRDRVYDDRRRRSIDWYKERLLNKDEIAIQLAAANINRGVKRLFRQYLYDTRRLETEEDIQKYLEEHGLKRDDLVEAYLQQEEYRASMFNMLAWSSQGIAESDTLRTKNGSDADIARKHASGGVRTINAILAQGLFGLTMDADGVRLFNDDDVYAYREA